MTRLIRIYPLIYLLFGALTAVCDVHSTGAVYKKAAQSLDKISDQELAEVRNKLKREPALTVWLKLLEVEHQVMKEQLTLAQQTMKSFEPIRLTPLEELHFKKLQLEIELISSSRKPVTNATFQNRIKPLKIASSLKSEIQYLESLQDLKANNFKRALARLQSIKLTYPGTVTASKAFALVEKTFKRHPSLNKAVKNKDYIIREIRALSSNNRGPDAYTLLSSEIKSKKLADLRDKDVFVLKIGVLKSQNKSSELKAYLEGLAAGQGPLKYSALSELALQAWNKNNTEELQLRLAQLGSSPFTTYLEARVAEESGQLQTAKEKYSWLYKIKGHQYLQQTGFRLAWLEINSKELSKATQTLSRLRAINNKESYYDTEAINYWLDKSKGAKPTINTPYYWDPRLYYFWLYRGHKVSLPIPQRSTLSNLKVPQCDLNAQPLFIRNQDKIARLAQLGLIALFEDELSLALPSRIASKQGVFDRASFALSLGGATTAIKEIRAFSKIYRELEKNCLAEILPILYPINHLEIFEHEADRTGIDKHLLMAITRTESTFDPLAKSWVGAMGLMQLMPATAELEGFTGFKNDTPETIFSPAENIRLGANHLKRLTDKYGDNWHLVIAAYNAGGQAVDRWIKRYPNASEDIWVEMINFKETRHYVKKVLGAYWSYKTSELLSKNKLAPIPFSPE